MATYFFLNTGDVNWGTGANWSLDGATPANVVPVLGDTVIFNDTSGPCTINTSARTCTSIDCTNYTNTLTFSQTLTVSGNVTLGAGMGIAGTGQLIVNATSTLTSNGKTWPNTLQLTASAGVFTLADDWTVAALTIGNLQLTMNGHNMNVNGNLTAPTTTTNFVTGTTVINLAGTGTWSGAGQVRNTMNINTPGTITVSGAVRYNTGTLTYVSGTVVTTGSTLTVDTVSTTLNTNGINWNNFTCQSAITITNNSLLTCNGTVTLGTSTITVTINGSSIQANGSFSVPVTSGSVTGTSQVILGGTGTWTSTATSNGLRLPVTINTSGTITLSGSILFNGSSLTYTAGTVVTTGNTLTVAASTTLNTNGINWNSVTFSNTITVTLSSNMTVNGTFNKNGSASTLTLNGSTLILKGNMVIGTTSSGDVMTGTSPVSYQGTGTWSGVGTLKSSLTINTTGTLTITTVNAVLYNTGTLTYTSGTVVTNGNTLTIGASTTLNTSGMSWNNITVSATSTLTLSSALTVNGTLTLSGSTTFAGTGGFTAGALTSVTAGLTHTFAAGPAYMVNNALTLTGTSASKINLTASSAVVFTLAQGATHDVGFVNATNINSGNGQTIWDYKGTLTSATNWRSLTAPGTVTSTFVF